MMPRCDIFCRVIDNLGDAGIAVHLARALSHQYGFHVRLFIDDPAPLHKLVPGGFGEMVDVVFPPPLWGRVASAGEPGEGKQKYGFEPPLPPSANALGPFPPHKGGGNLAADLVIELLGAEIPEDYIAAMCECPGGPPVWIRYDYLSAENWIDEAHLKSSPHPASGLARTFFYPGLTDQTGGILFSDTLSVAPPASAPRPTRIFMFSYDQSEIRGLADMWAQGYHPIALDLSVGSYLVDRPVSSGNLAVQELPFLPQVDFDQMIGTVDVAFIRGEDSFSQAIAAGVPVIWQIYPTDDQAHIVKLQAFCDRFRVGLGAGAARAFIDMQMRWNGEVGRHPRAGGDLDAIKEAWTHFTTHFGEISARARAFGAEIRARGSAAQNLVDFYYKSR